MSCSSQFSHASVLLRHLDQRYPFSRICLSPTLVTASGSSGWARPRARECAAAGAEDAVGGEGGGGGSGGWEDGSQGDQSELIWGEPKEGGIPLARSGGLATIGNHVVLRHAPVSQRPLASRLCCQPRPSPPRPPSAGARAHAAGDGARTAGRCARGGG